MIEQWIRNRVKIWNVRIWLFKVCQVLNNFCQTLITRPYWRPDSKIIVRLGFIALWVISLNDNYRFCVARQSLWNDIDHDILKHSKPSVQPIKRRSWRFLVPNISLGLTDTSIGWGKKRREFIGKSGKKKSRASWKNRTSVSPNWNVKRTSRLLARIVGGHSKRRERNA